MTIFDQGYQNEYAGIDHDLNLISLPEYQEGIKQAKTYQQKQRNNYTNLISPLVNKYHDSDPIKLIKACILSNIHNSTSLIDGITIIKSKKQALALAEESGHTILEIIVQDEKGIPSSEHSKKRFAIEIPWKIAKTINYLSMKSIILNDIIIKNTYLPTWWKSDTAIES